MSLSPRQDLSILIGLHDQDLLEWSKLSAESDGFSVYTSSCLEKMKALLGERNYAGYLMDLNLRHNGRIDVLDITPAKDVYASVRWRVEHDEAIFRGVSGRYEVVEAALGEKIPAEIKPFDILPFLHRCQEVRGQAKSPHLKVVKR